MDVRRVQITGGSSFMITLPKSWADSVNLKKNDPVVVMPQPNGGLLLTAGTSPSEEVSAGKEIDTDSVEDSEALYRELIGAYIAGNRQIIVISDVPLKGSMIEAISKFTQTSIGMEIVEEDEKRIVIQDLMDQTEVQPKKNVRREYLLVKRMASDVLSCAVSGDLKHLDTMNDRDTEVDRIHWLVQRQSSIHQLDIGLSARMGIDLRTVTGCVGVSKTLERMGDHTVLISKHLGLMGPEDIKHVGKAVSKVSDGILSLIDEAFEAWSEGDLRKAEVCIRDSKTMSSNIGAAFSKPLAAAGSGTSVGMVSGSIRRLAEYCSDIAESAINSAMES